MKNHKLILILLLGLICLPTVFSQEITKDQALSAIHESKLIIEDLQNKGFSVNYLNDTLIDAERIFQQLEYAEIIKSEDVGSEQKKEAEQALKLIDWENLEYGQVIELTDKIKKTKEKILTINDMISVKEIQETNPQNEKSFSILGAIIGDTVEYEGISEKTKEILIQAKTAFNEERYDDAESLIKEYENNLEKEKAEYSMLNTLQRGTKNFFQRNWQYILITLLVGGLLILFISSKTKKLFLKKKIRRMQTEKLVLIDLLKKAQRERYKENKISGLVYNIRMQKYKERLEEIKEKLPVLEKNLKNKSSF